MRIMPGGAGWGAACGVIFAVAIAAESPVAPVAIAAESSTESSAEARRQTGRLLEMLDRESGKTGTGEQFAWNFNYYLGPLLDRCRNEPNDAWLAPTERVLGGILDRMSVGPDGYRGFIGPYIYNGEHWCDVHVGDAILIRHALTFAEIVHDHPELRAKYGASADRFVATARRDLVEKWNRRGTYVSDGPFGGYREWWKFCRPGEIGDPDAWYELRSGRKDAAPSPALPFNKSLDMAECLLQLYRLTGVPAYRAQAGQICNRVKAGMNPFDGAYTWNYWEPIDTSDILDRGDGRYDLSHWVGTHPYRDYQEGEVRIIVFAYDMGVTFTEADIRRLVATNLGMMWNGDLDAPEWANSDSKLPGYRKAAPSTAYPTTAGTVWTALERFDPTIRQLAARKRSPNDAAEKSADRRGAAADDGFMRRYAPERLVGEPVWMGGVAESAGQTMAVAIPSVVPSGESTTILSKSYAAESSPVEIWVRPLDATAAESGAESDGAVLLTTQSLGGGVQRFHRWDGTIHGRRTPGEYVILWKYRGGERAYPVTLR